MRANAITPARPRGLGPTPALLLLLLLLAASTGCSTIARWRGKPQIITFTDKVWRVEPPSDIAAGAFYIFLSDGTLIIKAPQAEPLLGSWSIGDGVFTMVEEGVAYQVDVLSLRPDEFLIRSRNPGPPVLVRLVPADAPPEQVASEAAGAGS